LAKVPPAVTLDQILVLPSRPRLLLAFDGMSNSENMGVVIRNAVGFGVDALLLSEACAPPYLRRSVRNSMGAVFKSHYLQTSDLPGTLRELRCAGIRVIAAHPHTETNTLANADLRTDCCLVFGSEGHGISDSVLDACDVAVAIPMHSGTDSLNVASATAVFLFEAQRQRAK
jgi:tRNA G18 (ribose-2'-O)-methylase SpoU